MPPESSDSPSQSQQQSFRDVQIHGDDNTFNVIQGQVITLTQTKIIQIAVEEIKTREFITTSPYKGLKKFEPEDRDRFFGRDQFIAGLVNDLEHTNFILLLGASGSGKSSVVRAGLVPWLQQQWGKQLVSLLLTPDRDPFESLYGSLLSRGYPQAQAQLARTATADTWLQVVKTLKTPETFWLIVIDQFEELFTVSEPEKRDRCIESLVKLSQAAPAAVKIVATMRADFLDRLSPYPQLVKRTDRHRPLIAEMQADELRLAIEQPAAHHGVVLETGLVEEIITAVQGQAGCLPLLQYTLDLLWDAEVQDGGIGDRTLNTASYRRLGGVRGALNQRVQALYDALPAAEQLAVQRIFLKLVEIGGDAESGTDWRPVRRRARRSEFTDATEQAVLPQLIDQNLLVSDAVAQETGADPIATVEIAHEILLTSWSQLHAWIEANRQSIALRNRLNDDVAHWQAHKSDEELWTGSRLAQVVELRQDSAFQQVLGGFSEAANQFIDASVRRRERQRQRQLRTAWSITGGAIVALLVSSGLGWMAWQQTKQAELKQAQAQGHAANASFQNQRQLDGIVTAIQAGKILRQQGATDAVVMQALQNVYHLREQNRLVGHTDPIGGVSVSADGSTIASASEDKTVKLWNRNGTLLHTLSGHLAEVYGVSVSADGNTIASASRDKTVKLWNRNGKLLHTLAGHSDSVIGVSVSADGNTIASASWDKTVKLWNRDGQMIQTLTGHSDYVNGVSLSADGNTIASASWDKTVKLWNRDGQMIQTLTGHSDYVNGVSLSADGNTIASSSGDRTVKLWSRDDKLLYTLNGHTDVVTDVSVSADGNMIASVSNDQTVRVWSRDGKLLHTLTGHTDAVRGVSLSPDGNTIASASWDKTVKLWSRDGKLLHTLTSHTDVLNGVSVSADGRIIASASKDQTVRVWSRDGKLLQTLTGHTDDVRGVSVSADGSTLASASNDQTVKLWPLRDVLQLDVLLRQSCSALRDYLANSQDEMAVNNRNLCDDIARTP